MYKIHIWREDIVVPYVTTYAVPLRTAFTNVYNCRFYLRIKYLHFVFFENIFYKHGVVGNNIYFMDTKMGVGIYPDATFCKTFPPKNAKKICEDNLMTCSVNSIFDCAGVLKCTPSNQIIEVCKQVAN